MSQEEGDRGISMNNDVIVITDTLNRVAARAGDPASLVFKRLFAGHPAAEALFVRDDSGLVRGQMFQVTIESLLDFLGDQTYGAALVQIERTNHQGLGVSPTLFDSFYLTVMAVFRDLLGDDWTTEMEAVWTRVISDLTARSAVELAE
jgi:hemoglobin-like flavoprotein